MPKLDPLGDMIASEIGQARRREWLRCDLDIAADPIDKKGSMDNTIGREISLTVISLQLSCGPVPQLL
jgi:hypothetical protein